MKEFKKLFVFAAWMACACCLYAQTPSKARTLTTDMIRAMDNIITLKGKITRSERFKEGMLSGAARFRINMQPLKLYFYNLAPEEGAEVLWKTGWNQERAYVHPNKFPWVNLSISVYSSNFMNRQHHTILKAGFGFTKEIIKHLYATMGDDFDNRVKYVGKEKWYDKTLDVIKITNSDYGFVNYTLKAGENIEKLEVTLHVPAYKIMEINPQIEDRLAVKAGQVIKVPNYYAKEMIIMIDPENHLPIVQVIFDEKGLFEKYEFSELIVNKPFPTTEFMEECEDYGF